MLTGRALRLDVDGVEAVCRLDVDSRIEIGYVAAQLACVIESNYPSFERDRIEGLVIDFAHRLHLAEQEH